MPILSPLAPHQGNLHWGTTDNCNYVDEPVHAVAMLLPSETNSFGPCSLRRWNEHSREYIQYNCPALQVATTVRDFPKPFYKWPLTFVEDARLCLNETRVITFGPGPSSVYRLYQLFVDQTNFTFSGTVERPVRSFKLKMTIQRHDISAPPISEYAHSHSL